MDDITGSGSKTPSEETRTQDDDSEITDGNSDSLEGILDDTVSRDVVKQLQAFEKGARGRVRNDSLPNEEHIDYPESFTSLDRVLHVLWTQTGVERSLEWISHAAVIDTDSCRVFLEVLSRNGVVVTPQPHGADGYRLNPFYKQVMEFQQSLDRRQMEPDGTRDS